ncbi:unnamed protein product [Camellia sinensis]
MPPPTALKTRNEERDGQTSVNATSSLDAHLKTILENVKLLYLLEREGSWDTCQNWEDIRLESSKDWACATSVDVEEHLYRLASNMGITVVTSSQRPALIPFHSTELRLIDGKGKWELRRLKLENHSQLCLGILLNASKGMSPHSHFSGVAHSLGHCPGSTEYLLGIVQVEWASSWWWIVQVEDL